jgi:hypothetical protein
VTGRRRLCHAAAIVGALASLTASARADTLRWELATDGDACDPARFAREVQLACDALGGQCTVVTDAPARRAVLRCPSEGPWTLDAYDAEGRLAWTFALAGEDRARRAAIWVARAPADAPAPEVTGPRTAPPARQAEPDAGPNRAQTSHSTEGGPTTAAPSSAPAAAPGADGARAAALAAIATGESMHPPTAARRWGLLGAARIVSGTGFGPAVGGLAQVGWLAGPPDLALELDVAAERSLASPNGYSETAARAGAGASYGAPWGPLPVGVAVEGGAIAGEVSAPPGYTPSSLGFVHAFVRTCLALQLGSAREWRPYAAVSLIAQAPAVRVTSQAALVTSSPSVSGALDVGVAWLPR